MALRMLGGVLELLRLVGGCATTPLPGAGGEVSGPLRSIELYVGRPEHRVPYRRWVAIADEEDLILLGDGGEESEVARLHIPRASIRWISGGDQILSRLYQHAAAFIYPSLYEGFGIPPLEAMAHQCPVISSNSASLPEVLGNAAEYFDATDHGALARAIKTVTANPEHASVLTERGVQRVKQFTWKRCAEETLRAYRRIL